MSEQEAWERVEEKRREWRTDDPEELYWKFVDCQEYGWCASIMFAHHDGDVEVCAGVGDTIGQAVAVCLDAYDASSQRTTRR